MILEKTRNELAGMKTDVEVMNYIGKIDTLAKSGEIDDKEMVQLFKSAQERYETLYSEDRHIEGLVLLWKEKIEDSANLEKSLKGELKKVNSKISKLAPVVKKLREKRDKLEKSKMEPTDHKYSGWRLMMDSQDWQERSLSENHELLKSQLYNVEEKMKALATIKENAKNIAELHSEIKGWKVFKKWIA